MDNLVNIKPHIIIQARMGSKRLPGKVMKKIDGMPMIGYEINRLKKSGLPIVVATSVNPENEPLVEYLENLDINIYRGSEENVLERFYKAATKFNVKDIIRITADNPLMDGVCIKDQIEKINIESEKYYFSDKTPKTLPLGMSFEMFSFALLKEAYLNSNSQSEREHVTPYMHQNMPGNIEFYTIKTKINRPGLRLTVDTEQDFELIETLIEKYDCSEKSMLDIIEILNNRPSLLQINSSITQKKWNE